MTKIGWVPFKKSYSNPHHLLDFLDLVIKEPKKLTGFYKNNTSSFTRCPANAAFLKNLFVVRSPFDLEIKYFRDQKKIWVSQKQLFVEHMVLPRFNDYGGKDNALCSLLVSYMFFADEPVWVEVYPTFLHGEVKNTRLISGTFDIYNWHRPVDFSFEILNDVKPIKIKEGQPLFYVKFVSNKFNDDFELERLEWNDELNKAHNRCRPQNYLVNMAWKIMKLGNKIRPKKFLK